jgi:hypothetical protein
MKTWTACALLLIPALAASQSLGDAARKEAERRKKAQAAGTPAPVLGEEELSSMREKRAKESQPPLDVQPPQERPSEPLPAASPASTIAEEGRGTDNSDREREDRAAEEARWRARVAAAAATLDRSRQVYERLKDQTLVTGQYLVDPTGRPIATSPQQLQHLVAQAKEEYEAAQKALDDLFEAARREGVPPGWLR